MLNFRVMGRDSINVFCASFEVYSTEKWLMETVKFEKDGVSFVAK